MKEKLAVITGGASGIGKAIANMLQEYGYLVVIADIHANGKQIAEGDIGASFIHTDVRINTQCERLMEESLKATGAEKIDVLVANVGNNEGMSTRSMTAHEWMQSIDLNLNSIFFTCKPALGKMREGGRIILISSLVGIVGQANNAAYSAAKGGIIAYAKSLALETASQGITVNVICPHAVDTPLLYAWAETQSAGREATLEKLRASIPIGRFIKPEEVAAAALFLASPLAGAITGTTLLIDGGASLGC